MRRTAFVLVVVLLVILFDVVIYFSYSGEILADSNQRSMAKIVVPWSFIEYVDNNGKQIKHIEWVSNFDEADLYLNGKRPVNPSRHMEQGGDKQRRGKIRTQLAGGVLSSGRGGVLPGGWPDGR